VVYVLLAIGMIAMILMQRGAGAQAGSGFGAGASATVFGSRGAGNFLSKSTKWLAVAFFVISLFMAWYATNSANLTAPADQDAGLMSQVPAAPAAPAGSTTAVPAAAPVMVPAVPAAVPAGQDTVPAAPVPAAEAEPATPDNTQPAAQSQQPPAQGG
jgi:preprotein translocase subunit SecG